MGRKRHLKGSRPPQDPKKARRDEALAALGKYNKAGGIRERYAEILSALDSESARGAILLVGGVLDDLLGETIISRLPNGEARRKDLLPPGRMLGNMVPRMTLANAMGLIDQETWDELEFIRQLRNTSAHTVGPVSFELPVFREAMAVMFDEGTGDEISTGKVTPLSMNRLLGCQMIYLMERIVGKTKAQAQNTAEGFADQVFERKSSPEKPSEQPDPTAPPNQTS